MTAPANAHEVNFDCLVGPTHHFGGLSLGNLASTKNKARLSNPKKAALQGLEKMRWLFERGFVQAILPPHERPHMKSFKNLGFVGDDATILHNAQQKLPEVFASLCSSSAMWAANAATVSPSSDSSDDKVHISPANLITMFHRSIEPDFAFRVFKLIFRDEQHFVIHPPLPAHDLFSDEGAANHSRLCPRHQASGVQLFVYGKESTYVTQKTKRFPARQSKLANIALAERHRLSPDAFINIEQNADAIDHGAFHNDVVAVANESVLLCHEQAFKEQAKTLDLIRAHYRRVCAGEPTIIEIANELLPLEDAVNSYIFNSQLLSKPEGKMLLLAPTECITNDRAKSAIQHIIDHNQVIDEVQYFNVSESMANGGGPACLRLRVVVNEDEFAKILPSVIFSHHVYASLKKAIERYYVDELTAEHFFSQQFLDDNKRALEEISAILGLGNVYDFQR